MAKIRFLSYYSQRSAHAGYDVTGDRHLQSIYLMVIYYSQEEIQVPGANVLTSSHLQLLKELWFLLNHFC